MGAMDGNPKSCGPRLLLTESEDTICVIVEIVRHAEW